MSDAAVSLGVDSVPWATKIAGAWQKTTAAVIETGLLLIEARRALGRGAFDTMVHTNLPFSERTAQRLMRIASHPVLSNPTRVSLLPPSWGTLYELTKVSSEVLEAKIEDGTITPNLERADVKRKVLAQTPTMKGMRLDRVKQLRQELDHAQ